MGVVKVNTLPYRLKPPSTKAAKSRAGKEEALNKTMLHTRKKEKNEKKNLTVSHTQHRAPPTLTNISTIGKKWGHEKIKDLYIRSTKKIRKTGKS